jgi:hypothetical protein
MIASPDAMIDEAAIAKGLRFDGLAGNAQTVPARQQLIGNGACRVSQVRV